MGIKPVSVISPCEVEKQFSRMNCYLYSQQAAWIEYSKINIYYGIWKRIKRALGKDIFVNSKDNYQQNDKGQIKFYG